ncbi:MAG: hypothetical protein MR366_04780 [Succinivibrio sp.]|nr:hypothetical protein [Succinivibrio sp.]
MATDSYIHVEGNTSQLVIKDFYSKFSDPAPGSPNIGLKVTIYDSKNKKSGVIAEYTFSDSSDFGLETDCKIRLPKEFHNDLAKAQGKCHDRFYAELTPIDINKSERSGATVYLDLGIDGKLLINSNVVETPKHIELGSNSSYLKEDEENSLTSTDVPQDAKTESKQENLVVSSNSPKKKSRLGLVIGAIVGLILLLVAAFSALYFTGALKSLFGGSSDSQTQEQTVEEPKSEPQEQASDDNLSATEEENVSQEEPSQANSRPSTSNEDDVEVVTNKHQGSSSANPCSLSSNKDDMALIKGCLSTNPQADVVKSLIEESFANNRCNVGKRLLSNYGRRDAQFAYMYGQYFDENSSLSSSCEVKDIDKAIYWYEKAVQLGDTTNAKAALDLIK